MIMNPLILIGVTFIFSSCASIHRLSNEAIYHAVVGQNEQIFTTGWACQKKHGDSLRVGKN